MTTLFKGAASIFVCSVLLLLPIKSWGIGPSPKLLEKIKSGQVPPPSFLKQEIKSNEQSGNSAAESAIFDINALSDSYTGDFHALAILVDFIDAPAQTDSSTYDSLLFGSQQGNLKDYWSKVSYNNLTLVTLNMPGNSGWFTAPESLSYYAGSANGNGTYPNNVQKLAEDVIALADPQIDFSVYDNDGDGIVDGLFIIHAGSGSEYTGAATDLLSQVSTTSTPISVDGVQVSQFMIQPEYWQTPGDMTIGVFARNMAEGVFGLPDLRDRDTGAGGLGDWSLMGTGYWNGPNGLGGLPALPDAWSRWQMGFVTPTILATDVTGLNIPPAEDSARVYRVWTNGIQSSQYFLLENRQQTGYDTYIPGSGVLIYHVDESVTSLNRYPWYPGSTTFGHYLVALEQADNAWNLERAWDNGNDGDPFPGSTSNTIFNATSSPGSNSYGGFETFVSITNIAANGSNMTADVAMTHTYSWAGNALVWDADHTPLSGPLFQTLLTDSGYVVDYTPEILLVDPDSLQRYQYIFIALGMYPNNHVILDSEAVRLQNYLNLGGKNLYMEGGTTFRHNPQTAFHQMFNIDGFNTAKHDLSQVDGVEGTFLDSLSFVYGGENRSVDRLLPGPGAFAILQNPAVPYFVSIAYDDINYRTIGSSFEFGGLVDGALPSTKSKLFSLIMQFYGDKIPKPAPRDLVAGSGFNGFVPLTWDPPALLTGSKSASIDSVTSFKLYRSSTSGGPYTLLADVDIRGRDYSDSEDYIDSTAVIDSTYYYVATAFYNDSTESPYTSEVQGTPAADSILTQQLSYSGTIPTLDGLIDAAEWSDAMKLSIQTVDSLDSIILYMKNDETHLYIALDDRNNTHGADDNQLKIYFDDDNSMTWDPTSATTEGYFTITYKNTEGVRTKFSPVYGTYPDNLSFLSNIIPAPGVIANVSDTSGHMQYEVSIDLDSSAFTAQLGDTVRMYVTEFDGYTPIDVYYNVSGAWPYGTIVMSPQTFGPVVLGLKPDIPDMVLSRTSISEFVVGETSLLDTIWVKNIGAKNLGFSVTDSSSGWLSETYVADSLSTGDSTAISVTLNGVGLAMGSYDGVINIASNDPFASLVKIPVTLNKTNAFIRLSSLNKASFKTGESILANEELDTYLATQTVEVATSLMDITKSPVINQNRFVSLTGSNDDGFIETLLIPDTLPGGSYFVKIEVLDSATAVLQDSARFTIDITSTANWQITLTVENDTLQMLRVLGGDSTATADYDAVLDVTAAAPGSEFYSYFQISQVPNYLSTDFRNWAYPYTQTIDWPLVVVNTNGGNFSVSWDPASLPLQGNFTLEFGAQSVNMRTDTTASLSGDGIVYIRFGSETSFDYTFANGGWHLISLPVVPSDSSLTTLFPTAIAAFSYNNTTSTYESVTKLEPSKGYWLAIPAATNATIGGSSLSSFQSHLMSGWHLMGAVRDTADFTNPDDTPDGSVIALFGYDNTTGQYYVASSLAPGSGYWIAAFQECDLSVPGAATKSSPLVSSGELQERFENFAAQYGGMPPPPPAALNVDGKMELIKKFTLFQNYPNPFNPVTKIRYYLEKPAKTELEIYNILGQRINLLVDYKQNAGLYEIEWNGMNQAGKKVPSGIYFYRLKSGEKVAIKKMMILK